MGNLDQDVEKYAKDAKIAISRGDVLAGVSVLAKIGGEVSVHIGIAMAAIAAGAALSTVLGPLGIAVPTAAVVSLGRALQKKYAELDTRQRKGVAILFGILRGSIPIGRLGS